MIVEILNALKEIEKAIVFQSREADYCIREIQ